MEALYLIAFVAVDAAAVAVVVASVFLLSRSVSLSFCCFFLAAASTLVARYESYALCIVFFCGIMLFTRLIAKGNYTHVQREELPIRQTSQAQTGTGHEAS